MHGQWRIELLGGLTARYGDQVVTRFQKQKAGSLLAYLAYHPGSHTREVVAEALWPESDPEISRNHLRVTLHALRRQLEAEAAPADSLLLADRFTLGLRPGGFTTDVAEWDAMLQAASHPTDLARRVDRLAEAANRYGGDLLPGYEEEWVRSERERRAHEHLRLLRRLVAALEASEDLERAVEAAQRVVSADPLREEAHYELMRLYAAAGQPSSTLRQYQELERLLRERGETPSAATRALAEELQNSARAVIAARGRSRFFDDDRRSEAAKRRDGETAPTHRPRIPIRARNATAGTDLSPDPADSPIRRFPVSPSPTLPPQFTRFFGREEEIARVAEALCIPEVRLVTLTGPGGSGKTRLAIAVAGRVGDAFENGIWFVPLADLADARRVADRVAGVMELPLSPHDEPMEQVVAAFTHASRGSPDRRALLVLDNMEHLVEEGAGMVRTLLDRVPSLTCLVTSRQRLNLAGEQEVLLLPLPTPRAPSAQLAARGSPLAVKADDPSSAASLLQYPSVQLFVDRARIARPDFSVTEANAEAVAQLCDRLEGLPLALELAAARAAVLSPAQILAHLEQRFQFLVTRQRDLPPRHRSLLAAVEGSYQSLSSELRQFFARLSVFRGGWTLEAAGWVCGECEVRSAKCEVAAERQSALDCLEQLRECSLILAEETPSRDDFALRTSHFALPEMRYRLLETLRQYGWDRLDASGEGEEIRMRHRDWFLGLAERAEPELAGPGCREWLERLEGEQDNLRAALRESVERSDAVSALRLAGALVPFWVGRYHVAEGREWLAAALALPGEALQNAVRGKALFGAGALARLQEERDTAWGFWTESLAIRRRLGDLPGIAEVQEGFGALGYQEGDWSSAEASLRESLTIRRELGDRRGVARSLQVLAQVASDRGEMVAARGMYEEALSLSRELRDFREQGQCLDGLGCLAVERGDLPSARAYLEEALAIQRALEDRWGMGGALFWLGRVAFELGEYPAAFRLWEETLAIDREKMGRGGYVVLCLGRLALAQGNRAEAKVWFEQFLDQERTTGSRSGVPDALSALGDLSYLEGDLASARARYAEALAAYRRAGFVLDLLISHYALWHLALCAGEAETAHSIREEYAYLHRGQSDPSILAWSSNALGTMARYEGNLPEAERLHRQALDLYRGMEHTKGIAACLEGYAGLAAARGRMQRAACLLGAADALRTVAGTLYSPIQRAVNEATVAAAQGALGKEAFAAAWAQGRAMTPDEAFRCE